MDYWTMSNLAATLVTLSYGYLLVLSLISFVGTWALGFRQEKTRANLDVLLHTAFVSILTLSMAQVFQSVNLLIAPINVVDWWIPLVCKHSSILLYLLLLYFLWCELKVTGSTHCIGAELQDQDILTSKSES